MLKLDFLPYQLCTMRLINKNTEETICVFRLTGFNYKTGSTRIEFFLPDDIRITREKPGEHLNNIWDDESENQ